MTPHTQLTWLLFLPIMVPSLRAIQTQYCSSAEYHNPRGDCGNNLANILKMVCSGRGFVNPGRKRSDMPSPDDMAAIDPKSWTLEKIPENGPFISKAKAMSFLHKRNFVIIDGIPYRQGVTCQCCIHKCGYSEFEQYCLLPTQ